MIKNLLGDDEKHELRSEPELQREIENENILEIPLEETNANTASVNSFSVSDELNRVEPDYNFSFAETPSSAEKPMFQMNSKPESTAETARKSGLAYAAAITLFAAIAFLLGVGWFFDLLFGTSPWGIVVGIVLGSIIGFLNFFRMTSQILKDKD